MKTRSKTLKIREKFKKITSKMITKRKKNVKTFINIVTKVIDSIRETNKIFDDFAINHSEFFNKISSLEEPLFKDEELNNIFNDLFVEKEEFPFII